MKSQRKSKYSTLLIINNCLPPIASLACSQSNQRETPSTLPNLFQLLQFVQVMVQRYFKTRASTEIFNSLKYNKYRVDVENFLHKQLLLLLCHKNEIPEQSAPIHHHYHNQQTNYQESYHHQLF